MSGFENNVLVADNVNFNPNLPNPHLGTITTNGQLIIGSTALNPGGTHLNIGNITSAGGSVSVSYTSPNINLEVSGQPLKKIVITLTSLQLKALSLTPFPIIPAPGPGFQAIIVGYSKKFKYGGNNPFIDIGSTYFAYTNTYLSKNRIGSSSTITDSMGGTASLVAYYNSVEFGFSNGPIAADVENQPINLFNSSSAISGNASNDNTLTLSILYYIEPIMP